MTGGHGGGTRARKNERSRLIWGVTLVVAASASVLVAIFAFFHYFGSDESGAALACTARLYSPYNPKNLEQCMTVCMVCSAGVKTTCSTSCKLRGAQ